MSLLKAVWSPSSAAVMSRRSSFRESSFAGESSGGAGGDLRGFPCMFFGGILLVCWRKPGKHNEKCAKRQHCPRRAVPSATRAVTLRERGILTNLHEGYCGCSSPSKGSTFPGNRRK